jgi:hypothetical protein
MIGTLLKVFAYSKAHRTTFTMLHPTKAVLFRKFQWDMRHAYAPRITALGAAAVALPVGLWLGRRTRSRDMIDASGGSWRGVWRADRPEKAPRAERAGHDATAGESTTGRDSAINPESAYRDGPMARGRMTPPDTARSQVDMDGMRSANAMGPLGTRRMSAVCIDDGAHTG